MYKLRTYVLLLLFIITGNKLISGQEPIHLSLDNAQQYAVEYNITLKNADLAIEEAKKKIWETLAAGLPQVDATVDYSNYLGYSIELRFDDNMPATTIESKPTSNLNVTAGQLIFSGSYIISVQTSRILKTLTEKNYEKTELDIKKQVINSYYNILVAEKISSIYNKNLHNMQDIYQKTEAMYQAGILEVTDVDQLLVQLNQIEDAVKSTERQIELAYNLLRLQLGIDTETEIVLTELLEDIKNRQNFDKTLTQPFDLDENVSYQLLNTQEDISQHQIKLQRMSYLPTITGFYNYTYKFLTTNFDMTPPNMIGLNMDIPIFSSGMRRAKVGQAKIQYETIKNNKDLLEDQLLISEKQCRFNLSTALEQYESQKKNTEISKRVFDNITLKYKQGMISSLDLTTANSNYLQSEISYINALIELLQAQLELNVLLNNIQ